MSGFKAEETQYEESESILLHRIEQIQYLPFFLFLLAFTIRFGFFLISDEGGGDAIARVAMSRNISDHQMWLFAGVWQPLPFYLMAGALKIYNDPTLVPRFLSLLYGTCVFLPFFYLIKREVNIRAAIFSTIFLTLFINHIYLSVTSYAESLALFLIVSSLYYFLSYYRSPPNARNHLIYASTLLALACLTRPEGWLLIGPLSLLTWVGSHQFGQPWRHGFFSAFLFGIIPTLVLGGWFLGNHLMLGDAFYFKNWSLSSFEHINKNFLESWAMAQHLIGQALWHFWMGFWQLGPVLYLLILMGIGFSIYTRKHLLLLIVPAILLSFIIYQTLQGMSTLYVRYDANINALLIPFGGIAMARILNGFKAGKQVYVAVAMFCIHMTANTAVYAWAKDIPQRMTPPLSFWWQGYHEMRYRYVLPQDVKALCSWLQQTVKDTDKLMMDYAPFATHIIVYAGLDDLTQLNGGDKDMVADVKQLYRRSQVYSLKGHEFSNQNQQTREDTIYQYMSTYKPKFILYHTKGGYLSSVFKFETDCSSKTWRGLRFHCRHEQAAYQVYEIEYEE